MASDIENTVEQESIIRDNISYLLDEICRKAAHSYPRICARVNRSVDDKMKIVDLLFEMITDENTTLDTVTALANLESELQD